MADVVPERSSSGLRNLAIVLASLIIAVPMVAGRLTEAILDTANPADVDVTQPLAYLREVLAWGFGSLGLLLIVLVVVLIMLYVRTRSFATLALPLLIAVLQIILGLLTLLFSGMTDGGSG